MFLLNFLWTALSTPSVLIALGCVVLIGVMWVMNNGAASLLKILADWRVWMAGLVVVMALALTDLKKSNDALEQKIAVAEDVQTSKTDAAKTLTKRSQAKDVRAAEQTRISQAISNAQPGDALDAALDEIAAIQADAAPPARDRKPGAQRLRDSAKPDGMVSP